MNIVIAAGGTGGHIFPALSVAQELKRTYPEVTLVWIGTKRSREAELCAQHSIPLRTLSVSGARRSLSLSSIIAAIQFAGAVFRMYTFFAKYSVQGIVAFGGYVCAPVLTAGLIARVPFFLQEQNSVPGIVNRFFSRWSKLSFLGFPIEGPRVLRGPVLVSGNPVRPIDKTIVYRYPPGFDKEMRTILICGGSQGAASMNDCLISPIRTLATRRVQVIWQTGEVSFVRVNREMESLSSVFVFESIKDLYPFYAVAKLVIGRAGASTLAEVASFGLPIIMIPLPWATENHQWVNAGKVESKGWGIRIAQNEQCSERTLDACRELLTNEQKYNRMATCAREQAPIAAAETIAKKIIECLNGDKE